MCIRDRNKTKSDGTKKTNDKIYLSSTYGYEIAKNWYASGLMTFQTQFAKGYDYSVDPDVFISRFMSPGYLLIGAGFTWTPKSWFTATFTPATWRGTFVSSKILSDQGDFGVTRHGQQSDGRSDCSCCRFCCTGTDQIIGSSSSRYKNPAGPLPQDFL